MAFNPSSTIYLCNVPIDNTYQHQLYFSQPEYQQSYFSTRVQKTFANYLTVRKTLPDGSLQSSVRVDSNIDDLYNCNYMYYQNANHGLKWFYAFITNLIYINENTTEIIFETDVYQTWLFNVTLHESYVVREHSITDEIGDNIVPEKFSFQDYTYKTIKNDYTLNSWNYLIGATVKGVYSFWDELWGEDNNDGVEHSGIYQGVHFFKMNSARAINTFLKKMYDKEEDCILFIVAVPDFNMSNAELSTNDTDEDRILSTSNPAEKDIDMSFTRSSYKFDGYTPKNKKLWTAPFFKMIVTNHAGQQAEYNVEDFSDPDNITFKMYGDISANPSVTLVPLNYKGIPKNYDCGISLSGFPQVSFNSDTFKMWLAKNQFGNTVGAITSVGEVVAGVAMLATGAGALAGSGLIAHGASGVMNTVNGVMQASREPNKVQGYGSKTNLLTAMKMNKFDYYIQTIKGEYARTIDDFFTMYGYQTNKIKIPNVSSRPYYNYVQTVDVNITGGIPDDDMKRLKQMYNNGVTFWRHMATVGDYSVDNSPGVK